MIEKKFQTIFGHWIKKNMKGISAVFELKSSKTNSLSFSLVKPHQIAGLYHAKHGNIYIKLPDGLGLEWPFDCFTITGQAYVVIRFGNGEWHAIDLDVFVEESRISPRRSLTVERARMLSTYSSLTSG